MIRARAVALLLPLLLLPSPATTAARADEPAATLANGPQPVRVTTFLLAHPGVDDPQLVPVMKTLDDGLKRNPRLEMKDLDTRLADFAQEVPQEQIDDGRLSLQEGQKALLALDLPTAIKKLQTAVEILAKVLPYIKKQELADAMMALGAARFENGERREAKQTFTRLLTWRSDYAVDLQKYSPQILAVVEEAKKELERARRGSLEIDSTPPAAQAYVDGRYVGATPTFAEGLVVGEHWVTTKKEGFKKSVTPAQVSARKQEVVAVSLERSAKYLLVEQALGGVEKSLGEETLDASADNLKEVLFVDHAVFVRAAPAGAQVKVDAYLYDLRTRRRLTRVTKTVDPARADKELATLASALYLNVSYQPELRETKDAPPPKPIVRRPFWKSWWFWTATGAATTGIILGAVLGARAAPKSCPGGSYCFGVTY